MYIAEEEWGGGGYGYDSFRKWTNFRIGFFRSATDNAQGITYSKHAVFGQLELWYKHVSSMVHLLEQKICSLNFI